MREIKYYICPQCFQESLRYAILDLDDTNLEEGYCCSDCKREYIGLDHEQVVEVNPDIND